MMFKSEDSEGGGDIIAGEKKLWKHWEDLLCLSTQIWKRTTVKILKKREMLGGEARDIPDIAEKNVLGFWGKNKKVFRYENKIILDGKTGFICF